MMGVLDIIERLGASITCCLERIGLLARFFFNLLHVIGPMLKRVDLHIKQIYFVGVRSLAITIVSGLFVGMVLAVQGYEVLQRFGSVESLGSLVALSLVRELGPVVAALLFAGRAGSAMTAEIGLMVATEQIAAMDMMAVNPMARVIAPRFVASIIALPILAMIFSTAGIIGSYMVGVELIGIDSGAFWSQMRVSVDFRVDVLNGLYKAIVFGIAVGLISVFEGFYSAPTAEGVSSATTRTVVISSLTILALDFVLTVLMFRGLN